MTSNGLCWAAAPLVFSLLASCLSAPVSQNPSPTGGVVTTTVSAPAEVAKNEDRGDFLVQWSSPSDEAHSEYQRAFQQERIFENLTHELNQVLILPEDVAVQHGECGEENAFYDPTSVSIVLCWELFDYIAEIFYDPEMTEEEYGEVLLSAWLFIFFHELGHSLVDLYDLPITGREEDAVDDLATLILIDGDAAEAALNAAFFWYLADDQEYSAAEFSDEHSLEPQRFYTIVCVVYGSDPDSHQWLVEEGHLTPERAERCPAEYQQKDESWSKLLEPWMKE